MYQANSPISIKRRIILEIQIFYKLLIWWVIIDKWKNDVHDEYI